MRNVITLTAIRSCPFRNDTKIFRPTDHQIKHDQTQPFDNFVTPFFGFLVSPGLWHGRAVKPTSENRRTLFEPFEKTQGRLREFARRRTCPEQGRRSQRTAQGTRRATPRPTWFWPLLPKKKGLDCRGETRQTLKTDIALCLITEHDVFHLFTTFE
jgi:hypothetical protein